MRGRKYSEVAKQIFAIVAIAGVVVVVAAAPGVLLVAKLFEQNGKRFPKNFEKKAARSLRELQKNDFIKIREKNGKFEISLTKKGRKRFKVIQLQDISITKPPRWDKKWRIIIFDIPDKSFKRGREALRGKLKEWEFYQLQKSVWVCPWPCEDEIKVVAELYGISRYANIIIAEKIVDDVALRKYYKL
jgi:DNA-binding transcriptional regulator PaaX